VPYEGNLTEESLLLLSDMIDGVQNEPIDSDPELQSGELIIHPPL
jgi:hypothetical protein